MHFYKINCPCQLCGVDKPKKRVKNSRHFWRLLVNDHFLNESMTLATAFKTEAAESKTMLTETAKTRQMHAVCIGGNLLSSTQDGES